MQIYYDPLYGQIELEEIVFDFINKCPELKRLKYIGLMNFKSIQMLSLTSTTRLEHTVGVAYLAQTIANNDPLGMDFHNDLIVASLFHDVNCGSFGHSIEWAIERYTEYQHDKDVNWINETDVYEKLKLKPIFIEQNGLQKYNFEDKYNINYDKINNLIQGKNSFILNNRGIDIDNIDSVFRMALYMGLYSAERKTPKYLVDNLIIDNAYKNFITNEKSVQVIQEWYRLRTNIYSTFIYSGEYFAFESLLFNLVSEYVNNIDRKEGIKNLFHYTDENFLWYFHNNKNISKKVKDIARSLLLHNLPITYAILRSDDFKNIKLLLDNDVLINLARKVFDDLAASSILTTQTDFYYHITTDDRKTNRQIEFFVKKGNSIEKKILGKDKSFILLGILGKAHLKKNIINSIIDHTIKMLSSQQLGDFYRMEITDKKHLKQGTLF